MKIIAPMQLTALRMIMAERNGGDGSIKMEHKTR